MYVREWGPSEHAKLADLVYQDIPGNIQIQFEVIFLVFCIKKVINKFVQDSPDILLQNCSIYSNSRDLREFLFCLWPEVFGLNQSTVHIKNIGFYMAYIQ